ncbi:hypothetical protein L2E82_08691 [Cichorium intybus]|uniref:Uncharacterized protein n=1 Tax=Cichorium intybus TaxID=13427 RepID=A0ACB9G7T6_CICIN|nr:hypothetical protein L2E82_08691 [Cichorium intybus]
MGSSRKLLGEIDRVLKKVQESVDVFDSIWNKVYDTDNAYKKEKLEADLKKEMKKLQRYRDQIKTWIQSGDIKYKKSYEQALTDACKLIEREMDRFKIFEKETKTKPFSKEGLGQHPRQDLKEKAKSETRYWLNNVVSELESQIDSFEAEIEGLSLKKGKARHPRLRHLGSSIARHKAHIMKLELILRLLDNDELSPQQVDDVKDFIDDYVERNQEDFDEFDDVDMLYETLSLDNVEALEDLVNIRPPGLVKVGTNMDNTEQRLYISVAGNCSTGRREETNGITTFYSEEKKQIESQPFVQVDASMDNIEQRLQARSQLPVIVPLTEKRKQIESQPFIQVGASMDNIEERLHATCQLPIIVPPTEGIEQKGYMNVEHLIRIPLQNLNLATNNFSKEYVIAKGGFGLVYKAQNEHGTIALKKLDQRKLWFTNKLFPPNKEQVDFGLEAAPHLKLLMPQYLHL